MTSITSISDIPSNYHCHRRLFKLIWGDYTCPECNEPGLKFRDNYEWCPHCRKKFSVKGETFFRHSKLSYKTLYTLVGVGNRNGQLVKLEKPLISRTTRLENGIKSLGCNYLKTIQNSMVK